MIDTAILELRRQVADADLSRLSDDEARLARRQLARFTDLVEDLAVAVAGGDEDAERRARTRLRMTCDTLRDIRAIDEAEGASESAELAHEIITAAASAAEVGARWVLRLAAGALADAMVRAYGVPG